MKGPESFSLLDRAAGWSAAFVACGFVVSLIYDWGFYGAINRSFSDIPTTISDHFRTGLLWFPYLLGLAFVYLAFEFQLQRLEKGLTEQEIIESTPNPVATRRFRERPYRLIVWIAPLGVVNFILMGDLIASLLPFAIFVLWITFADWCYSAPLIKVRRSAVAQAAFTLLPALGIVTYFTGYSAAVEVAQKHPIEVAVTYSNDHRIVKGRLLRTLDRGVLILMHSNSMMFIEWSAVSDLLYEKPYVPFPGILCKSFSVCIPDPMAPKSDF